MLAPSRRHVRSRCFEDCTPTGTLTIQRISNVIHPTRIHRYKTVAQILLILSDVGETSNGLTSSRLRRLRRQYRTSSCYPRPLDGLTSSQYSSLSSLDGSIIVVRLVCVSLLFGIIGHVNVFTILFFAGRVGISALFLIGQASVFAVFINRGVDVYALFNI